MGLAQTGTGKTAAFLLPIFQRLIQEKSRNIRALILAPTRELAEQINQACGRLGRHTGIHSTTIYGGVKKGPQLTALRRGPEIVVACPGRLLDHLRENDINLRHVEVLVLDEADTMCDMGFLPDVRLILEQLPSQRQTLFFSATMPEQIRRLSQSILNDPVNIQIDANAPANTVSHALYPVTEKLKRSLLLDLLSQTATGKVVIFTRTKHRARSLTQELEMRKFRVTQLHGNLSQNRRQRAMQGFSGNKFDLLVATDIAAHGIDVSQVSHVINFDMPNTVEAYTHRIGRTGRALQTGEAFTLATPDDAMMVRSVERAIDATIERRSLEGFRYGDFKPERQFTAQSQVLPVPRHLQPRGSVPNRSAPRGNSRGRPGSRRPQGQGPGAGRQQGGPGASRQENGAGPPVRRQDGAGPSRQQRGPGPGRRQDGSGPSRQPSGPGPSRRQDGSGQSRQPSGAGPGRRQDGSGQSRQPSGAGRGRQTSAR
jgi:ATP-dependent RNA helicase RhlE